MELHGGESKLAARGKLIDHLVTCMGAILPNQCSNRANKVHCNSLIGTRHRDELHLAARLPD